jgi:molecular chaperone GrpE
MASSKKKSAGAGAADPGALDPAAFEQLRAYNDLLAQADQELSVAKARIDELEGRVGELSQRLAEAGSAPAEGEQGDRHLDALRRMAADFDNYKKRQARERDQIVQEANKRLVVELLPVLDDLERALDAFATHGAEAVQEGVALVHRALRTTLEKEGVSPIDPKGARFDPQEHEALASLPAAGVEEGTVIEVVQRGFRLGDRVLRPARVVVAAAEEA